MVNIVINMMQDKNSFDDINIQSAPSVDASF